MPDIEIGCSDFAVPAPVIASSLRGVQSLVTSANYKEGDFFTQGTKESVRDANACNCEFMSTASFEPWEGLCNISRLDFVAKYFAAFETYLARKKKMLQLSCIARIVSHVKCVFLSLGDLEHQVRVTLLVHLCFLYLLLPLPHLVLAVVLILRLQNAVM